MCRSGRCWRCADTSQDTAGHEKTQDACPGVGIEFCERRLRNHRSSVFLDQVEELLTAPPPTLDGSRARTRSFEELPVRGAGRRRPLEAGGAERPRSREFLSRNFCVPLCLAVTRCVPLALAVSRWIPLLTWIVVTPRLHGGRHGSRRPRMLEALARHGRRDEIHDFLAQGDRCGWCRHPIRLRGFVVSGPPGEQAVTFSSASLPDGVVLKACGSRSEIRCPSCAAVYRGDSRHLVRAGLEGGKGVDEAIALHPAVFLTLTAPGFGAVHTARAASPCHAAIGGPAVRTAPP